MQPLGWSERARWGHRLLSLALVGICAGCGVVARTPERPSRRPDLILVSIDTLRADHLGSYGSMTGASPFLDRLAESGTRFADAWSPSPWTLPSHATMLSGVSPIRHGAVEDGLTIATNVPWLAETLSENGYWTGAVITALYTSGLFGFDRGFSSFEDLESVARWGKRSAPRATRVFERASEWGHRLPPDRPAFLFLHLYDVHWPYDPPSPWDEHFDRPSREDEHQYRSYQHYVENPPTREFMDHQVHQYDEEIAYVDAALADFRRGWTKHRPETIFVVVSDHGEEFLERGSWGHAHTLFPELLRVPWIVSGPGVRAQVIEARVGLEDLAPTLASLAAVPFPQGDGVDRADQIRTGRPPSVPRGHVPGRFAETSRHDTLLHRWHRGGWDLHHSLRSDRVRLFDLRRDAESREDLVAEAVEEPRARRMTTEMYRWLGQPWETVTPGRVRTDGILVVDGSPRGSELEASAGRRFAAFPLDAPVTWIASGGSESSTFHPLTNPPPPDHPGLRWLGLELRIAASDLGPEQRARLEALGYVQ